MAKSKQPSSGNTTNPKMPVFSVSPGDVISPDNPVAPDTPETTVATNTTETTVAANTTETSGAPNASEAPSADPASNATKCDAAEQLKIEEFLERYGVKSINVDILILTYGIETLFDLTLLSEEELMRHSGLKLIKVRKMLTELREMFPPSGAGSGSYDDAAIAGNPDSDHPACSCGGASSPVCAAPATTTTSAPAALVDYRSVLRPIPTEEAWTQVLQSGGELKIDEFSIMSAIRALTAARAGFYQVPQKILKEIDAYVDEMDEPSDSAYFDIRTTIYQMEHPEIFGIVRGDREFVPNEDKRQLLTRIAEFIPSLREGFQTLGAWQRSMETAYGGPALVLAALDKNSPLGDGIVMPSYDAVHDASLAMKDFINHAFRGRGMQTARALARDAQEIRRLMDDARIPKLLGAASREQMLKRLGINVATNYIRQENAFTMFVQNFIFFSDGIAAGNEIRFLSALWQLGSQLNWGMLGENGQNLASHGRASDASDSSSADRRSSGNAQANDTDEEDEDTLPFDCAPAEGGESPSPAWRTPQGWI